MLKLKKSRRDHKWILYNPDNFKNKHTHCHHKRVALKIKYHIEHQILPTSRDLYMLESYWRVCPSKGKYRKDLRKIIEEVKDENTG